VTPLGASSQGLSPGRGGGFRGGVLSISGRERSSPLILRAFLIIPLSLGIKSGSEWSADYRECVDRGRRLRYRDQRITGMSGSNAACPRSGPVVRCYDRRGPTRRGCSGVRTTAREKEVEGHPRAMERRIGLLRPRADASSGLASRADPTLHMQRLNSCSSSLKSKEIPAGGRKSGLDPKSSIIRWRAPITAGRTTCAQDLRKRRGA